MTIVDERAADGTAAVIAARHPAIEEVGPDGAAEAFLDEQGVRGVPVW